mmetsp:Transcript_63436/g.163238  ORF Transcript_63436/g.163238 Transcript_63436/m.163238 type:complete len:202 (-) Transcript_63436:378-983(-)
MAVSVREQAPRCPRAPLEGNWADDQQVHVADGQHNVGGHVLQELLRLVDVRWQTPERTVPGIRTDGTEEAQCDRGRRLDHGRHHNCEDEHDAKEATTDEKQAPQQCVSVVLLRLLRCLGADGLRIVVCLQRQVACSLQVRLQRRKDRGIQHQAHHKPEVEDHAEKVVLPIEACNNPCTPVQHDANDDVLRQAKLIVKQGAP